MAVPSLLVFGRLSLVGTVANLLAVPVAGAVMLVRPPGVPASPASCRSSEPVVMAPVGWGVRWVDAVATVGAAVEPSPPWSWLGWAGLVAAVAWLVVSSDGVSRGRPAPRTRRAEARPGVRAQSGAVDDVPWVTDHVDVDRPVRVRPVDDRRRAAEQGADLEGRQLGGRSLDVGGQQALALAARRADAVEELRLVGAAARVRPRPRTRPAPTSPVPWSRPGRSPAWMPVMEVVAAGAARRPSVRSASGWWSTERSSATTAPPTLGRASSGAPRRPPARRRCTRRGR